MRIRARAFELACGAAFAATVAACLVGAPSTPVDPGPTEYDAGYYYDAASYPDGDPMFDASLEQPRFGPTVTLSVRPPPISGGTLLVAHDGTTAVAADPDRDAVFIVDLSTMTLRATVAFEPGDEPGRLVEDAARRVHVATRRGGALVSIDLATGTIVARRAVCSAPRGVAYDTAKDSVLVACAGGDLVTFPAAGGVATTTLHIESDLRDVVVLGSDTYVTLFRSAELLRIANGVTTRHSVPDVVGQVPGVAWRAIALPGDGGVAVVHQLSRSTEVDPSPGGYGGSGPDCDLSLVSSAVTTWRTGQGWPSMLRIPLVVLPVDVAISANGAYLAVAAAGNGFTPVLGSVIVVDSAPGPRDGGTEGGSPPNDAGVGCASSLRFVGPTKQVTAVAFDGASRLVAFQREPAALLVADPAPNGGPPTIVELSNVSRADTGHDIFHSNSGALIACASCHSEGGDDARIWTFTGLGQRRTPSLRGTIAGTAPYHWDGAMSDFAQLEHVVFEGRMSGPRLQRDQIGALQTWVEAIPPPPQLAPVDPASAARGQTLFTGGAGCAGCHSGPKHTNNATVDVGTDGAFQVPSLVGVAWRAPLMHSGCASTMEERFTACATIGHGNTGQLASGDVADLVAYLSTL